MNLCTVHIGRYRKIITEIDSESFIVIELKYFEFFFLQLKKMKSLILTDNVYFSFIAILKTIFDPHF